jgi:putative endopeptidase
MGIGQDGKDSTKYAVYLSQGGLGLPDRDYYLDDKYKDSRDAYVSHITNMLTMRGDKKRQNTLKRSLHWKPKSPAFSGIRSPTVIR